MIPSPVVEVQDAKVVHVANTNAYFSDFPENSPPFVCWGGVTPDEAESRADGILNRI